MSDITTARARLRARLLVRGNQRPSGRPITRRADDAPDATTGRYDEIAVPAGYPLVYDGEWNDEVFVIVEGSAVVIVDGRVQDTLGPGAVVSASASVTRRSPGTTVVASSPMRFVMLDTEGFAAVAANYLHLIGGAQQQPPGRR